MARIVEIYEDAQLAKQQVESRKVFGWSASVELTERGVFEVTFTRDESTARNAKLKELEDDFLQCSVASDYIERYNGYNVNKKKFKAFHPFLLLVVIYIIFSTLLAPLSSVYIKAPSAFCLKLFTQAVARAFSLALFSAGKSIPARIAMIAITTRSSIKVNDLFILNPFIFGVTPV